MFPLRECHVFMAAMRRAGYSYYIAAHNTSSAPPLHTHMEDSTLELVSGVVSRLYQGVVEDTNLFTIINEPADEVEEEFPPFGQCPKEKRFSLWMSCVSESSFVKISLWRLHALMV